MFRSPAETIIKDYETRKFTITDLRQLKVREFAHASLCVHVH